MTDRKILFVSSNFPPVVGGSAVVYDQLCEKAGGKIIALSSSRDYRTGDLWPSAEPDDATRGYQIYRIPYLRPPAFKSEDANKLRRIEQILCHDFPLMFQVLWNILKVIRQHRVQVVCIGELIYGGWLVFPLRYMFRRRVLIYTHGEEIAQDAENFLARRRGLFLRHANKIISVSLFCKGEIVSKYRIAPENIQVINNGVDLETFCRSDGGESIWPEEIRNRKIILSVSRLVDRKGQETLLRSMPDILSHHPDAYCVIVGGGPLEQRLKCVIDELGLGNACAVVGPTSQDILIKFFQNCDLFVLPCRTMPDGDTEGFGLVFLEAGACGKAVVAGAAGGTIEAVIDDKTGILVDGSNSAEVAQAVNRLLHSRALADMLGEQAWRHAQMNDWHAVTQRFLNACETTAASTQSNSYLSKAPAFELSSFRKSTKNIPGLLVTVDVEEEFRWDQFNRKQHLVRGVEAIKRFHRDCKSIGVSPVYLLTYPIMMNSEYRGFFQDALENDECELGIHLHSWTTPPHWEQPNVFTSYQCNLPEHVEYRKLEELCKVFRESFGCSVQIHRAGRWGGNERTSTILDDLGIHVDLSPSVGYRDAVAGGPNFSNLDGTPFWSGNNLGVLTIPGSSINYLRGPNWLSSAIFHATRHWRSVNVRIFRRGKPVRFSPENADKLTLLAMAKEIGRRQWPVAVYTLHSTSLYSGGNPYSLTEEKTIRLRKNSVEFLSQAIRAGLLRPTTCKKLLAHAMSMHNGEASDAKRNRNVVQQS